MIVEWALVLGPAEYFALMVLCFVTVSAVLGASPLRGLTSLAFGLMLAEALTGQHPFENEHHLFFAITQMEPGIPPDLPFPFMDIIRGCLVKKCSTRWTAPQVLTLANEGNASI